MRNYTFRLTRWLLYFHANLICDRREEEILLVGHKEYFIVYISHNSSIKWRLHGYVCIWGSLFVSHCFKKSTQTWLWRQQMGFYSMHSVGFIPRLLHCENPSVYYFIAFILLTIQWNPKESSVVYCPVLSVFLCMYVCGALVCRIHQ